MQVPKAVDDEVQDAKGGSLARMKLLAIIKVEGDPHLKHLENLYAEVLPGVPIVRDIGANADQQITYKESCTRAHEIYIYTS